MLTLYGLTTVTGVLHLAIVVGIGIRLIMLRPSPSVTLAWLFLVAAVPFVGLAFYLLIGERRIGQRRARRLAEMRADFDDRAAEHVKPTMLEVDWASHPPESRALDRLGTNMVRVPTVAGNTLDLHADTQDMLTRIAADVDAAEHSVSMEFYIWHAGGTANTVLEALERAARRGVACRLLVDQLGARPWWKTDQPKRLRAAGVQVRAALPTGLIRGFFARNDLRLHRKIVAIDGKVAWTGSMNMVDPRHFKQDAGVGEWIDAMVRIEGSAVLPLGATMLADWQLETGEPLPALLESAQMHAVEPKGRADVQVIASGPGESDDAILQMILALLYVARREIVLTTPYFVPDQAMLLALRAASARGVDVHLVVPAENDSIFVRHASQSYYEDLLEAGVTIQKFHGGLLHTKSITVDDEVCMFGTVNLDMRSLWLNHEVSCFIYDRFFTRRLRALQQDYLQHCDAVDPEAWRRRPWKTRFVDNVFHLVAPLL